MINKLVYILGIVIICQACNSVNTSSTEDSVSVDSLEQDFPWRVSTTKAAEDAIIRSIKNINSNSRENNFPANPGPFNVKFDQFVIEEFAVIGYSFSHNEPDIYEIEFRPEQIKCCDNRITVRINIQNNEVFMVFMKPDA